MIKEIAQIFNRYDPIQVNLVENLLENKYGHEAAALYENFEDLNIYNDKTLRQYVQVILRENAFDEAKFEVCEELIRDLHFLLFKS